MIGLKDHYIKIEGSKIHCVTAGSGEPLIMVHGLGGSLISFKENIKGVSNHFKIFALDLPGFGDSEEFRGVHNVDNFVLLLEQFLDRLNIKRASILGHSMGGAISFKFALKNPNRVDRLVLVGTPFYFPRWFKYVWYGFLSFVKRVRFEQLMKRIYTMRWFVLSDYKHVLFFDWKKTEWLETIFEMARKSNVRALMEAGKDTLRVEHRVLLKRLECPTLIVEGDHDPIIWSIKNWVDLIPNHKFVVIPKTRHCMLMEKWKEFNEIVLKFLKR